MTLPLRIAALIGVSGAALFPAPSEVENSMRQFFTSKKVTVKLDMPATSDGVDVTPGEPVPLDTRHYSNRIARYGVAIREGDAVVVTNVEVKDKVIELHLAGGGFQHWRASSGPSNESQSSRERDLEKEIRKETDSRRRDSLRRELDSLRRSRERENALNADLRERQKERNYEQSLRGGSRFNLRFPKGGMEKEATPEIVMRSLAEWVSFEPARAAAPAGKGGGPALKRGMSERDVAALLGRPIRSSERTEGDLKVVTRVYRKDGRDVECQFAEGVLVRFRDAW